jgi:hypothetical protein
MNITDIVNENFADGRVKGKSRPGRVKRAGVSCKDSVTDLRKRAKKASGEKAKMLNWCANMKSGKKRVSESKNDYNRLYQAIKDFLPLAMNILNLDKIPKINLVHKVEDTTQPTFGVFTKKSIKLGIDNRHPVDVCRTLAHELVHFKQLLNNQLTNTSGETGSKEENQANSQAGIIMRKFNSEFPQHLEQ